MYFLVKTVLILFLLLFIGCNFSTESISSINRSIIYNKHYDIQSDFSKVGVEPWGIFNTSSGGLIVCGVVKESASTGKSFILKLDEEGNQLWQSLYNANRLISTVETPDGCIVAVGAYAGGIYVVKCDNEGNIEWEKYINILNGAAAHKIILTKSNHLIVLSNSYSANVGVILKLDLLGNLIWKKFSTSEQSGRYHSISENGSGNFNIIGSTSYIVDGDRPDSKTKIWFEYLDSDGVMKEHIIFGEVSHTVYDNSVIPISESLFLLNGRTYIVYLDSSGSMTNYPIPYPDQKYYSYSAYDLSINYTGNIFMIGALYKTDNSIDREYDLAFFKLSPTGGLISSSIESNTYFKQSALYLALYNDDESIITAGYCKLPNNQNDRVWVSKFHMD